MIVTKYECPTHGIVKAVEDDEHDMRCPKCDRLTWVIDHDDTPEEDMAPSRAPR